MLLLDYYYHLYNLFIYKFQSPLGNGHLKLFLERLVRDARKQVQPLRHVQGERLYVCVCERERESVCVCAAPAACPG
jgi:hypothetical protein